MLLALFRYFRGREVGAIVEIGMVVKRPELVQVLGSLEAVGFFSLDGGGTRLEKKIKARLFLEFGDNTTLVLRLIVVAKFEGNLMTGIQCKLSRMSACQDEIELYCSEKKCGLVKVTVTIVRNGSRSRGG